MPTLTLKILKSQTQSHPKSLQCLTLIHTTTLIPTTQPLTSLQCGSKLQFLTNTKSIQKGQQLHAHIIVSGTLDANTYLNSKLAAFYASCGKMTQAQFIFDQILLKNSFLWNYMIRGYACNGDSLKSVTLYREMLKFGQKPDKFTYPFVLKACGDDERLREIGRIVHSEVVVNGLSSDVYVGNSLIAMYAKFGDIGMARLVFDKMPQRDLTSWNTLISGYVKNGDASRGLVVLGMMGGAGVPADSTTAIGVLSACSDIGALKEGKGVHGYVVRRDLLKSFVTNAVIGMYCCCNSLVAARRFFDGVKLKDTVGWNSMISGYARDGDAFEGLRVFCRLVVESAWPDQVTFVAVLGACVEITALQFGLSVHCFIVKTGFGTNAMVGTALMDMYSKCGSLDCSRRAFDEMPEKNMVSWSAMISGYGLHGRGREAISVFQEMKANGIVPDDGVFTTILSACSHAGLVNEGKEFFHSMTKEYSIKPGLTQCSRLIDLLGRAGCLDEAYAFIKNMEIKPTSDIWAALLSACRLHRSVELAELSAQKVFEMDPRGIGSYISLSNLYALEKRWDDVERVRALIRGKGLKKVPGCSFVEVDRVVHRFLVGDESHQQKVQIYNKLKDLRQQLKEAGYKPDTSSVFYDVEQEVKEKMLWDHSERLAIAFALINTGPGSIIRVTKNLRTCSDCHTVIKLISKLTGREIIVRDARRFHHFKDGHCSCCGYW